MISLCGIFILSPFWLGSLPLSLSLRDKTSGEPVAFANILFSEKQEGTISDIQGQFLIPDVAGVEFIRISCLGYKSETLATNTLKNNQELFLVSISVELSQITILPGKNPAIPIMQNAVANRYKNNPDQNTAYKCIIYHKMSFGMETPDTLTTLDKSLEKLWNFNRDNDFLLIESVSEKKHLPPNKTNERIISGRVSGFQQPALAMLPTQLQPFTFYNNYIRLLDSEFLNPVSPDGLRTYLFILEDSIINNHGEKIYYISFEPRKNAPMRGLKGSLHIHTPSFAIQSVSATTIDHQSPISLSIRQNYAIHDGLHWFPEQLETRLRMSRTVTGQSFPFPIIGEGKSMVTAVQLNPPLSEKDFSAIELIDETAFRETPSIEKWRYQPLTARDSATYRMIDSLGRAHRFDRFITLQKNLLNGYLPLGSLNLNVNKLLDYNHYEGIKPGIGLQTGDRISKKISLEGFYSRSTKSGDDNYGGSLRINMAPLMEQSLKFFAEKDLYETGGFSFLDGFPPLSDERFKRFATQTVDRATKYGGNFTSRVGTKLKTEFSYAYNDVTPVILYPFFTDALTETVTPFQTHEAAMRVKWQPLLRVAHSGFGLTPLGNEFPAFWLNIRSGIGNETEKFNYTATEFQFENNFRVNPLIAASVRITSGNIWGEPTLTQLYSTFGTSRRGLSLESRYSFATMRPNEFAASSFSLLFIRTSIPTRINHAGKFKPVITLSSSAGWADISNQYKPIVQTFNKGFYESGIYIGNILKQMFLKYGLAVHYRYGPYQHQREIDNWSFKIGVEIGI
ncbi:DUF5686 family protein [Alkaliflexus imshenetskii]|uniref:DUF5686 family protein n=1 Tax=Alkaliflexus imshenetskii TaxID=286730 RepID=UPI0005C5258C|nr:DUF5686 family protein [Alkaliflexus imshenetskii]